jgi:alpha-tubulin suppressor-like RCC1 family protein
VSNALWDSCQQDAKLSVVPVASWGVFGSNYRPARFEKRLGRISRASQAFALKPDGAWVSWGSGSGFPPDLTNVVAVTAGSTFSLALRDNGTVVAWGGTNYGETDVPAGLTNVVGNIGAVLS